MKAVVKWAGIVVGGLLVLLLIAVAGIYAVSEYRFNRRYDVTVQAVPIPADPTAVAYGEHLASIRGCKGCHGENLSGEIEFQDPLVGVIANANLTGGAGSEVVNYTPEDWVRSIFESDPDTTNDFCF